MNEISNRALPGLGKALLASLFVALAPLADVAPTPASDETPALPLWEVNLFNGAARVPHYRGANDYSLYALPLPYLIYRGDWLRIDRDGLQGFFWQSERIETGLSLAGHPPAYTDNKTREGMHDLGAIVEAGPMLQIHLLERERANALFLLAAARMAFSVDTDDLGVNGLGWRSELKAVYRNRTWLRDRGVSFSLSAGVDFTDRGYNRHFYDVAPKYATASRPAYRADGGYAGFNLSLTAQKKLSDRWALGVYYRWDNLSGAAFGDSPLVKNDNNHTVGVALIWNLFRSKKTVDHVDL